MQRKEIKSAIESLLFVYSEPISIYRLAKTLDVDKSDIDFCLKELNQDYIKDDRGIRLIEVNNKYQLGSSKKNHKYIEEFCKKSTSKGLSESSLEVLAIIAYKQPVTRIDIESIRGVRSGNLITNLLNRDLIFISGRLETIGSPNTYSTTEMFLKGFGFESIKDLPKIDDFHNFEFLSTFNLKKGENEND
ncbi:SMC-Scp complex subunit ScpB [Clostridiaceae bacterium HSG29]|nr:SMC-Scp complex subunit ScpB [Clostridiaceae bacterium HSG29]